MPSSSSGVVAVTPAANTVASTSDSTRGEAVEFVRSANSPKAWLVVGRESHRVYGITDTIPDARGYLQVHMFGRKKP